MDLDPADFLPPIIRIRRNKKTYSWRAPIKHLFVVLCIGVLFMFAYLQYYNIKTTDLEKVDTFHIEKQFNMLAEQVLFEMRKLNQVIRKSCRLRQRNCKICQPTHLDETSVDKKIQKAIDMYDADKTGLFDFASEYAGGKIISTPNTESYPLNKSLDLLGFLSFDLVSNPEAILKSSTLPGSCFAFKGWSGSIRIKLGEMTPVQSITLEHTPQNLILDQTSAPREFEVYGYNNPFGEKGSFLGKFCYKIGGRPYQTFNIDSKYINMFEYVDLRILNNYGKQEFTCVYRFRVHGDKFDPMFH